MSQFDPDNMPGLSVGLLLFPGFQVMDAAGPIDILNSLNLFLEKPLSLAVIAQTKDPVSPGTTPSPDHFRSQQQYLPTHTFDDAPALDLLIVPGGRGTRQQQPHEPLIQFIRKVHDGYDDKPPAKYLFSVCTGSALFAMSGILDGHNATSNKVAWSWATSLGPKTYWVAQARWVNSGRIWTTSGVTAGIDGMAALVAHVYGEETAQKVCNYVEHHRVKEPSDDQFCALNGCKDVPPVSIGSS